MQKRLPGWNDALQEGLPEDGFMMVINTERQELTMLDGGKACASYPVSTSRNGLGCEADSNCTPTGWHEIADRIGEDAALGQVFVDRNPTDEIVPASEWQNQGGSDRILTRILRLRGLEEGLNAGPGRDSYDRLIYIHGTDQEHLLGQPQSHGCIRMANTDIVELYDRINDRFAFCWIGRPALRPRPRD